MRLILNYNINKYYIMDLSRYKYSITYKINDLTTLQNIINENDINILDHQNNTLLHRSIEHYELVKYLIEQNIDINALNRDGESALSLATYQCLYNPTNENIDILVLLLKSGADVNYTNIIGDTLLDIVHETPYKPLFEYFGAKRSNKIINTLLPYDISNTTIESQFNIMPNDYSSDDIDTRQYRKKIEKDTNTMLFNSLLLDDNSTINDKLSDNIMYNDNLSDNIMYNNIKEPLYQELKVETTTDNDLSLKDFIITIIDKCISMYDTSCKYLNKYIVILLLLCYLYIIYKNLKLLFFLSICLFSLSSCLLILYCILIIIYEQLTPAIREIYFHISNKHSNNNINVSVD